MTNMDYWDWVKQYKPLNNHINDCTDIDGCLFLPYGNQFEFVRQFKHNFIWSLIVTDLEDDTTYWEITTGMHVVNLQGYLITKRPWYQDIAIMY